MDLARVREIAANVDISWLPLREPVTIEVLEVNGLALLRVSTRARDIQSGKWTNIYQDQTMHLESFRVDEKMVLKFIRWAIQGLLIHELDENFLYKGERVFDPHEKEESNRLRFNS